MDLDVGEETPQEDADTNGSHFKVAKPIRKLFFGDRYLVLWLTYDLNFFKVGVAAEINVLEEARDIVFSRVRLRFLLLLVFLATRIFLLLLRIFLLLLIFLRFRREIVDDSGFAQTLGGDGFNIRLEVCVHVLQ